MARLEDVIITFRTETLREHRGADYRSNLAIYHAKTGLGPLPPVDPGNMGPPAVARVDLGRWLVDCGDCANAAVVDDLDLFFICTKCGSRGSWREVIMPAERAEIDEILLMRPGFRDANLNRFWFPGESIDKLMMENIEHEIPIPQRYIARIEAQLREILQVVDELEEAD